MKLSIPVEAAKQSASPRSLTGEAAIAFVCFVLSDEAQRPSLRGRRQKLPLQGRLVNYGVRVHLRRGSDRSERIYVSVTALQLAGWSNYEACCEVAGRWESKLGKSRRGRPRKTPRSRELVDKVEIVRSIYNAYKLRHPWKEKLPERDLVYEQWCGRFQFFQQWIGDIIFSAQKRGLSGEKFAEELAHARGQGGRNNCGALTGLGQDGLTACLSSWRLEKADLPWSAAQIKKFVREFFNWAET